MAWARLDEPMRDHFMRSGVQLASTWAHFIPAGKEEDEARDVFRSVLPQIGLSEAEEQVWILVFWLLRAACGDQDGVVYRCARLAAL